MDSEQSRRAPATVPWVLVVDDEALMRASLARLLAEQGYQVESAASAAEALGRMRARRYDLVLVDLMMPGMTGHALMAEMRQRNIDSPVIVVSGDTAIDSAIEALRQGAHDFVRKPYEADEMLRRIENALAHQRLQQENAALTEQLRRSEQWHRYLVNHSVDLIYTLDPQGRFTFVNHTAESLLHRPRRELIGRHYSEILPEEDRARAAHVFDERRTGKRATRGVELRLLRARSNGDIAAPFVPIELHSMGMYDTDKHGQRRFVGTYGIARDITDRKRAEEAITYQAYHDLLTGLANRSLFLDRLNQAINQAKRNHGKLAVMFLDLDRFKFVNDNLGHIAGDKLLHAIATRLKSCLREVDTLARLGGDEFVLLLPQISHGSAATVIAEKILHALAKPFVIDEHELFASLSIGIALYPGDGDNADALIKHADMAMYAAKNAGRNTYQIYTHLMDAASSGRLALAQDLRRALERDELVVYYQPQVEVRSGRIVGLEALLRWHHPTEGLLEPAAFISLAEDTGLVCQIGEWVLRTVCAHTAQWRAAGLPPVRVSINLSPQQLQKDRFEEHFLAVLRERDVPPALIGVEITENTMIHEVDHAVAKLNRLRDHGVEVALDDFGTGYASLSHLKQLPIHTLKVDQSFVREMAEDRDQLAILRAVAAMAQELRLRLVAEGVETAAQREMLDHLGCPQYQGFLFSAPVPAEDIPRLLATADAPGRATVRPAA